MMLAIEDELDELEDDAPAPPDVPFDDDDDHGDRGDDGRWVTVATFWQSAQVHIARLRLESVDIDCIVIDENLVATDWLLAPAVGGIKLQVREADAIAAREALRRCSDAPDEPEPATMASFAMCPECGSDAIARPWVTRRIVWTGLVALMISGIILLPLTASLFVAYLILLRPHRCETCGHEWIRAAAPKAPGFPIETSS
jgi:predicted RNA-binding Zn-ribbon protein involved in translation (DUF1610 family)